MNRYTISLTITNEANNEQFIQLHTVHMTGKQVHDLVGISVEGVLVEPEPPILKARPIKRGLFERKAKLPKGAEDA